MTHSAKNAKKKAKNGTQSQPPSVVVKSLQSLAAFRAYDMASSGLFGVTTYRSKRTVLPIVMNSWKNT